MLFDPIRLKSPSGQNLEIQLETHVYSRKDSQRGLNTLKGKEVVGFEGVKMTSVEKFILRMIYFLPVGLISLMTGRYHGSGNPTITQSALCAALNQKKEIPLETERIRQQVCDPLFGSDQPELPSLKRVERLESELTPTARFFFGIFEARFCFILGLILTFGVSRLTKRKQIWTFANQKVAKTADKILNPFRWHRFFWERKGRGLSRRQNEVLEYSEMGLFYSMLVYQILIRRNQTMAQSTDEMVRRNGYGENLIVVGALHFGIAGILVKQYGYQRVN